ncbi:MAG: S8 family serine peptidase [Planctomycetia bacterium]|nr:S8 family serine peptidase [Planctomycetia bacterium]
MSFSYRFLQSFAFRSSLLALTISAFIGNAIQAENSTITIPQPARDSVWLQAMNVDKVTNFSGKGVTVTVIDDSVYSAHPWYSANILKDENDVTLSRTQNATGNVFFVDDGTGNSWITGFEISDTVGSEPDNANQGHGTNVTGSIYQVATDAGLIGVKSNLSFYSIPYSIRYATDQKSNIISNSYGASVGYSGLIPSSIELKLTDGTKITAGLTTKAAEKIDAISAFNYANASGAVILFAAGNERVLGNGYYYGMIVDDYKIPYLNSQDSNKMAYQAAPQTITVAALNQDGTDIAWFSNYGACVLVSAPGESITTSKYNYETSTVETASVDGTSFSCPLAAGCVALATEAAESVGNTMNSRLAKHLMVESSTKVQFTDGNIGWNGTDARETWVTNGAGKTFSHSYGFGCVNAEGMVDLATKYTVSEQSVVTFYYDENSSLVAENAEMVVYLSGLVPATSNSTGNSSFITTNLPGETTLTTMPIYIPDYDAPAYDMPAYDVPEYDTGNLAINTTSGMATTLGVTGATDSGIGNATVIVGGETVGVLSGTEIYSESFTIAETAFTDMSFQSMEEVAVTMMMSGQLGALEVVLSHTDSENNTTSSVLAFAQETSNNLALTQDAIFWTFSSNAFWGEDVEGTWDVSVYNMYDDLLTSDTFNISDTYLTFYMGNLIPLGTGSDVPEPATWILLLSATVSVLLRAPRKNGKKA